MLPGKRRARASCALTLTPQEFVLRDAGCARVYQPSRPRNQVRSKAQRIPRAERDPGQVGAGWVSNRRIACPRGSSQEPHPDCWGTGWGAHYSAEGALQVTVNADFCRLKNQDRVPADRGRLGFSGMGTVIYVKKLGFHNCEPTVGTLEASARRGDVPSLP